MGSGQSVAPAPVPAYKPSLPPKNNIVQTPIINTEAPPPAPAPAPMDSPKVKLPNTLVAPVLTKSASIFKKSQELMKSIDNNTGSLSRLSTKSQEKEQHSPPLSQTSNTAQNVDPIVEKSVLIFWVL